MQMHIQHHKYKRCTQTQPPSLTASMATEHIQDTPGTAAWDSAHFSDNTPCVTALQQSLLQTVLLINVMHSLFASPPHILPVLDSRHSGARGRANSITTEQTSAEAPHERLQ